MGVIEDAESPTNEFSMRLIAEIMEADATGEWDNSEETENLG